MSNGYVICCNDSIEAVVTTSEKYANKIKDILEKSYIKNNNLTKEGAGRFYWHVHTAPYHKELKSPELTPLDMSKSYEHTHPDIVVGDRQYLCLIDKKFFIGRFKEVWFGLNFSGWGGSSGLQFDAPGFNKSMWQQIWEIKYE